MPTTGSLATGVFLPAFPIAKLRAPPGEAGIDFVQSASLDLSRLMEHAIALVTQRTDSI